MEKVIKNFRWNGFGFPVIFSEIPAVKLNGKLVPNVNWKMVRTFVLAAICAQQETALTGDQIQFIRKHFEMTIREFAKWIGVSHSIIVEWEKKGAKPAKIESHTEFVLRLYAIKRCHDDNLPIEADNTIETAVESIKLDVLKKKERATKPFPVRQLSPSFAMEATL
ncbi:MAG: hypothetical protein JSU04_20395 [Bdellovibrionales bacterium]|nr:hypothetical protein [Bdellovibrionales bacterium]